MAFTTSGQETEWSLFLQPRSPHMARIVHMVIDNKIFVYVCLMCAYNFRCIVCSISWKHFATVAAMVSYSQVSWSLVLPILPSLHLVAFYYSAPLSVHLCVCASVCVCICLSASISLEPLDRSLPNSVCRSPVAVARSSSVGVMLHYVLPVLWLTSRLAVMGHTAMAALRYWGGVWCLWMLCF